MTTLIARDPSRLGRFTLGYSRLGTYTSRWEDGINRLSQSVTWRVANWHTARDSVTGWRRPDYSLTHSIKMVLVEKGGSLPGFAAGVAIRQNAVGLCMDGVWVLDQIKFKSKIFEVDSPPETHYDPEGGFAYRVVQLTRTDLFREG